MLTRDKIVQIVGSNGAWWSDIKEQIDVDRSSMNKIRLRLERAGVLAVSGNRMLANGVIDYFLVKPNAAKKKADNSRFWDDGTPKSKGNAFDLAVTEGVIDRMDIKSAIISSIVSKQEKTQIAYSRARASK